VKFFSCVEGDCMEGAGMNDGDLICVDSEVRPAVGDIVWCIVDGRDSVKAYLGKHGAVHSVSTRYRNRIFQQAHFVSTEDIRGVVLACYGPPRWERIPRPPLTEDNLHGGDFTLALPGKET